jgi:hypothetical protein
MAVGQLSLTVRVKLKLTPHHGTFRSSHSTVSLDGNAPFAARSSCCGGGPVRPGCAEWVGAHAAAGWVSFVLAGGNLPCVLCLRRQASIDWIASGDAAVQPALLPLCLETTDAPLRWSGWNTWCTIGQCGLDLVGRVDGDVAGRIPRGSRGLERPRSRDRLLHAHRLVAVLRARDP